MATVIARRLCAIALIPLLSPSAVAAQEADVIVRNARIWTGDTLRPSAQAVAIRGDRLIAVGTNAAADAHRDESHTRDRRRRTVHNAWLHRRPYALQSGRRAAHRREPARRSTAGPFAQRVKAAVARMSPGRVAHRRRLGRIRGLAGEQHGRCGGQPRPARFTPDRSIIDSVSGTTPDPAQPVGSQRVARERRGARARGPDVRTTCRGARVRERAHDRTRGGQRARPRAPSYFSEDVRPATSRGTRRAAASLGARRHDHPRHHAAVSAPGVHGAQASRRAHGARVRASDARQVELA